MNVTGIIFANDGTISALTEQRTMASLPFGGRYRQVDFALSNLVAAGIRRVGIITRHSYQSLMNHVGSGEEWGLEMEEGGLEYLTPFSSSRTSDYRGKLESLYAAMSFLKYGEEDELLVMVDSAVLSNIDLSKVIASHIESGKDITVVTKAGFANGDRVVDLALKRDRKGNITDLAVDYAAPKGYEVSMDIFVLSKNWLVEQVKEHIARNLYHMDRDLVLGLWQKKALTINVFPYKGVAMFNESLEEYFANSLAIVKKEIRDDLFGGNHPVYTKVRDRVPSYYGENCDVENCSVADGCFLEGSVKNSVLFRQVTIAPGVTIEDSIVMNDTVVGEGAQLKYVILDKDVVVRPGAKLQGTAKNPLIIRRGEVV
ncbi:MAG: glucose-1-phosphate adenylyltransferase subunit GlgD [Oscillospiraceae bacterium]|nr:glucose-1-phosphate adenylyltransferase subunit GlgD [Oscillospiraceae bacterium]